MDEADVDGLGSKLIVGYLKEGLSYMVGEIFWNLEVDEVDSEGSVADCILVYSGQSFIILWINLFILLVAE